MTAFQSPGISLRARTSPLALAVAAARPDAVVHAVEADPAALSWARRNIAAHTDSGGTPVTLHAADVRWPDLLPELESRVDLVLCNPPYVAEGAELGPGVAEHEPAEALFAGGDGLDAYRVLAAQIPRLLGRGGLAAVEIGFDQGEGACAIMTRDGLKCRIAHDLSDRPRALLLTHD